MTGLSILISVLLSSLPRVSQVARARLGINKKSAFALISFLPGSSRRTLASSLLASRRSLRYISSSRCSLFFLLSAGREFSFQRSQFGLFRSQPSPIFSREMVFHFSVPDGFFHLCDFLFQFLAFHFVHSLFLSCLYCSRFPVTCQALLSSSFPLFRVFRGLPVAQALALSHSVISRPSDFSRIFAPPPFFLLS